MDGALQRLPRKSVAGAKVDCQCPAVHVVFVDEPEHAAIETVATMVADSQQLARGDNAPIVRSAAIPEVQPGRAAPEDLDLRLGDSRQCPAVDKQVTVADDNFIAADRYNPLDKALAVVSFLVSQAIPGIWPDRKGPLVFRYGQ